MSRYINTVKLDGFEATEPSWTPLTHAIITGYTSALTRAYAIKTNNLVLLAAANKVGPNEIVWQDAHFCESLYVAERRAASKSLDYRRDLHYRIVPTVSTERP